MRAPPTHLSPGAIPPWTLLPLLGLVALASACGPSLSEGSSRNARPWAANLASLFDDQNDTCTEWLGSFEPRADSEKHRLAQRAHKADIVAVGHVQAMVRADSLDESKLEGLQLEIREMLRGAATNLPAGGQRLLLPLSPEQESRITNGIIDQRAVLFLRWVPGSPPTFRWHLTCASPGVVEQTKTFLESRRRGETPP